MSVTDTEEMPAALYTMDAFGNVLQACEQDYSYDNGFENSTQPYALTTKEFDFDVDLYYFNARWYDPTTGRFVSRAAAPDEEEHPYSYVANRPTVAVDWRGESIHVLHPAMPNTTAPIAFWWWVVIIVGGGLATGCGGGDKPKKDPPGETCGKEVYEDEYEDKELDEKVEIHKNFNKWLEKQCSECCNEALERLTGKRGKWDKKRNVIPNSANYYKSRLSGGHGDWQRANTRVSAVSRQRCFRVATENHCCNGGVGSSWVISVYMCCLPCPWRQNRC